VVYLTTLYQPQRLYLKQISLIVYLRGLSSTETAIEAELHKHSVGVFMTDLFKEAFRVVVRLFKYPVSTTEFVGQFFQMKCVAVLQISIAVHRK
jgi:hypothetical protein